MHDWLTGLSSTTVTPVPKEARAGEQGTAWDVLTVACQTGGAATVAVQALKTWLESRVTTIRVKLGEAEIEAISPRPGESWSAPQITHPARASLRCPPR
jgi:hypothetical protein